MFQVSPNSKKRTLINPVKLLLIMFLVSLNCESSSETESESSFTINNRMKAISNRVKNSLDPNDLKRMVRNSAKVIDLQNYF